MTDEDSGVLRRFLVTHKLSVHDTGISAAAPQDGELCFSDANHALPITFVAYLGASARLQALIQKRTMLGALGDDEAAALATETVLLFGSAAFVLKNRHAAAYPLRMTFGLALKRRNL